MTNSIGLMEKLKFIMGTKEGMTQIFQENGRVVPVTLIKAEPVEITQIKEKEKDGYEAIQVGVGKNKKKKGKKALATGRSRGADLAGKAAPGEYFRFLKEFRGVQEGKIGEEINLSVFRVGDKVKVAALTKGKGFQGAVKRHGFHGMPASHGHKHVLRHVGSIGQRFPQHTLKGTRMAGRMGGKRMTVRGLEVVGVDEKNNILLLRGAVPGRRGSWVEVVGLLK